MRDDYTNILLRLILNTAEGRVQFVVQNVQNNEVLTAQEWYAPTSGVEVLAPAVQHALTLYGLKPQQISAVACVAGPGSFTGLRLALTTTAGIARGTGALQASLSYLHLLAAGFGLLSEQNCTVWAMIHARSNSVVFQQFTVRDNKLGQLPQAVGAVLAGTPEQALQHISKTNAEKLYVLGSGVVRNLAVLQEINTAMYKSPCIFLGSQFAVPSLQALAVLGSLAEYGSDDIEAVYVRPCDAVDNLPYIAEKMGRNVEETLAALQIVKTTRID